MTYNWTAAPSWLVSAGVKVSIIALLAMFSPCETSYPSYREMKIVDKKTISTHTVQLAPRNALFEQNKRK